MIVENLAIGRSLAETLPEFVLSIPTVILSIFVGVVVAVIAATYNKRVIGSFVRFLTKSGACTEETAIRLADTDYAKKRWIRYAIAHNYTLRKYLRFEGEKDGEKRPDKAAILSRRYYIPEDKTFAAEELYSSKGSNPVAIGLLLMALLAVVIVCLYAIPYVMRLFGQLIDSITAA